MHVHFTGIAGSLLAPLAVELKNQGHKVTGSDKAFYPPASTLLQENGIKIIPGFKAEKFYSQNSHQFADPHYIGTPKLAVMQAFLTPSNPEIKFFQENNVEIIGLGQLLERYFIKENSVVITGAAGKTTVTSLVAWILETAKFDPTVMVGGVMNNFSSGVKIGKSDWSVTEGDEFMPWHISRDYKFTRRSRIHYQKPLYAIFTGASWDHYDLFPTHQEYIGNFTKFFQSIPANGLIVANAQGENVKEILKDVKAEIIWYNLDYHAKNISFNNNGSNFELWNKEEKVANFELPMLGKVNVENAVAAITLSLNLGIKTDVIKDALKTFKGIKRRQECRGGYRTSVGGYRTSVGGYRTSRRNENMVVFDDFAHSPVKVESLLDLIKTHYPKNPVILIYQPGSKDEKSINEYTVETLQKTDFIFLPHISSITKKSRGFNQMLFKHLKQFPALNLEYQEDDEKLLKKLTEKIDELYSKSKEKVVIVFAGQKGFRGMIEELMEKN